MGRPSKEFQAFDTAMRKLLTVPKATILERHAEHREKSDQNPRKRGPKRKATPPSAPATESGD